MYSIQSTISGIYRRVWTWALHIRILRIFIVKITWIIITSIIAFNIFNICPPLTYIITLPLSLFIYAITLSTFSHLYHCSCFASSLLCYHSYTASFGLHYYSLPLFCGPISLYPNTPEPPYKVGQTTYNKITNIFQNLIKLISKVADIDLLMTWDLIATVLKYCCSMIITNSYIADQSNTLYQLEEKRHNRIMEYSYQWNPLPFTTYYALINAFIDMLAKSIELLTTLWDLASGKLKKLLCKSLISVTLAIVYDSENVAETMARCAHKIEIRN